MSDLLRAIEEVRRWALRPQNRWSAGRLTVLGDAAHPMLPFMARGANQAIEDAAVLAACLARVTDVSGIPGALRATGRCGTPTHTGPAWSRGNARTMHLADGAEQRRRDAAVDGYLALRNMAWLYVYDAERAAGQ